jgi:hypothetical protein
MLLIRDSSRSKTTTKTLAQSQRVKKGFPSKWTLITAIFISDKLDFRLSSGETMKVTSY